MFHVIADIIIVLILLRVWWLATDRDTDNHLIRILDHIHREVHNMATFEEFNAKFDEVFSALDADAVSAANIRADIKGLKDAIVAGQGHMTAEQETRAFEKLELVRQKAAAAGVDLSELDEETLPVENEPTEPTEPTDETPPEEGTPPAGNGFPTD